MTRIAISWHISCQNHVITRFPIVKLMIPGGHEPLLGPKTDLTRRNDCEIGGLLWSKINVLGPASLKIMSNSQAFQPYSGQKAVLMCSNASHSDFIAYIMPESWNQSFSCSETNDSWWSRTTFPSAKRTLPGKTIAKSEPYCGPEYIM